MKNEEKAQNIVYPDQPGKKLERSNTSTEINQVLDRANEKVFISDKTKDSNPKIVKAKNSILGLRKSTAKEYLYRTNQA